MGWALVFLMHFIKTSGDADTLSTLQTKLDVSTDESSPSVETMEVDFSNEDEYFTEDLESLPQHHDEEDVLYRAPKSLPLETHEDGEWETDYIGGDADATSKDRPHAAIMQQSISDEEAEAEEYAAMFQRMIEESMGDDGEEEVLPSGSYDASQAPCVHRRKYLHETFVHAGYSKSSYICKPCHVTCFGMCKGPEVEDCLLDSEVKTQTRRNRKATASFVASFEKVMKSHSENTVALMDLSKMSDPNQTSCEVVSSVPVNTNRSFYGNITAALQLVVDDTSTAALQLVVDDTSTSGITDLTTLKNFVQDAIKNENARNGILAGVTEEVKTDEAGEMDAVATVVEDGKVSSSVTGTKAVAQTGSPTVEALVQSSCKAEDSEHKAMEVELEKTEKAEEKLLSTLGARGQARRRQSVKKNQAVTNSRQHHKARRRRVNHGRRRRRHKRRRRNKNDEEEDENEEETEYLLGGEGECVDAVAKMVETAQLIYDCYKSNYAILKNAFCEPAEKHNTLKKGMEAMMVAAEIIQLVTAPLQYVPYVKFVAKPMYNIAKIVRKKMTPLVRTMRTMRYSPYGTFHENANCCPPKTKDNTCNRWPYKKYKCASCQKGIMCHAARACNTLIKLEEKIDTWKEEKYDPYIEHFTEGAAHQQALINVANGAFLQRCGITHCSHVLHIATWIENQVKYYFLDRFCPVPLPTVNIPSFNLGVMNFLIKIGDFFKKIKLALGRFHCFYCPWVDMWWQRVCTRVCIPCCGWRGRRRWVGHPYCNWCCHHVCVPVLRARAYMKRFCFSFMAILKGLGAAFRAVLGPVLAFVEAIIDALMAPIKALINAILDKLGFNVNFGILPLPQLPNIQLPNLPTLHIEMPSWPHWLKIHYENINCQTLKNLVYRNIHSRVSAVA